MEIYLYFLQPAPFLRRNLTYVNNFTWMSNKCAKKRRSNDKMKTSNIVDQLMQKKVKHFLNVTITDFSCEAFNIECYAQVEMFQLESNRKVRIIVHM